MVISTINHKIQPLFCSATEGYLAGPILYTLIVKHGLLQNLPLIDDLVHMAVCQNLVPLVNIKIAGKWMFIPLKMVLIGIDPYPFSP